MPNRIIKESICTSEEIDLLDSEQEVFFYRLMVVVDDFGLMDARLSILKAKCYPLKSIEINSIQLNLARLLAVGLVKLYQVDGKPFLSITNWAKHQQIRAKRAKYPTPDRGDEITCNQLIANAPVIQSNPILSLSGEPDPAEQKPKKQNFTAEATEVLLHLNQVAGTKFQPVAANLNLIASRLREGFTVDAVKAVVNRKHREWGTGDMRKYLRPETLFNATKFAGYAGQAESAATPEKPTMTREEYEAKRKAENAAARERYQREQETITVSAGGAQ